MKDSSGSNGKFSSDVGFCKLSGEVTGLAQNFLDALVDDLDAQNFFARSKFQKEIHVMDGTLFRRLMVRAVGEDGKELEQNLEIHSNGHTPYDSTIEKLEQYLGRYLDRTPIADFIETYKRSGG